MIDPPFPKGSVQMYVETLFRGQSIASAKALDTSAPKIYRFSAAEMAQNNCEQV